jgi:hypothetical protein
MTKIKREVGRKKKKYFTSKIVKRNLRLKIETETTIIDQGWFRPHKRI